MLRINSIKLFYDPSFKSDCPDVLPFFSPLTFIGHSGIISRMKDAFMGAADQLVGASCCLSTVGDVIAFPEDTDASKATVVAFPLRALSLVTGALRDAAADANVGNVNDFALASSAKFVQTKESELLDRLRAIEQKVLAIQNHE